MASVREFKARLRRAVAELAAAIDRGDCKPIEDELVALAILCDNYGLGPEAERVRRWIA